MKKNILYIFALVAFLVSCGGSNDKVIGLNDIPNVGQSFINKHFSGLKVSQTVKDNDGSYDVRFTNGTEVDFDTQGNWTSVSAADGQVIADTSFIPDAITSYVAQNYPKNGINGIEKTITGYEVELVGLAQELTFDKNGNFTGLKK
ncbi:hypothetical protein CAPN001_03610 [Capnocytophaga stomatis]|uniref:Putative beta-lactamase-inhibitor-like PepSY-like domain-containing protein n=1 Tax=Capnocytophaga stomatis TaxID=1848904 RepID=A0A250FVD9_9FLAO|nr:PepSY-like domain-containing protein [Capnocytophaga stomatis]ATA88981.1 hypothetical protein CGC58_04150 [Capnocytophaga stomatis]GIJ95792.1 hypothetical protein CAPN001_03610 [Capnocytophaga stomatis]GIM48827.1 hypothetical protein CAPN003_02790 [Capnocytophaga stomatis]